MINNKFFGVVTELRKEGKTWLEVRNFLFKAKAITNQTTEKDVRLRYQELAARVASGEVDLESENDFEKAIAEIDEFIGRSARAAKSLRVEPKSKNKVLVISDPHIPYFDRERLWKAVNEGLEAGCNILVINGDYLNGERLSTHAKFKHESFKEEVAFGTAILEQFCELFEVVYLLDDNHVSDRWRRLLGNMIPADLHFLMTHPYDYMCAGLDNVVRACDTHKDFPDELGHFMILGDAMFSHGFVCGKDGESVRKVQKWYHSWKDTLKLPKVRVFLHGHTHKLGINFDTDGAIIQTGTLASLEGLRYSMEGNLKYEPPVWGYTILEQNDGVTDLATIRVVKL